MSAGSDEWRASEGARVSGMYPGIMARVRMQPGDVLVDVGTGRGELLVVALEAGARLAIGIEYSRTAVAMARRTLVAHGTTHGADVILADVRAVPLPNGCADVVTSMEVVEHLAPAELELSLAEAYRILRPGGRIVIHTAPNRTVYDLTYRAQRLSRRSRRRRWPADPRGPYEHSMHVNEQTVSTLRRAVRRAGFTSVRSQLGHWVYTDHIPDERARRTYKVLARLPLLKRLAVCDIWAEGVRPRTL